MQYDIRSFAANTVVKASICIIGSGPAGMVLADELMGSGVKVAVLESGENRRTKRGDDLNTGFLSGMLNQSTQEVRARQVGGTANHWIVKMAGNGTNGFRYVPLQDMDFAAWPIAKSDIDPYYERVHQRFNLGPFSYKNLDVWKENTKGPMLTNDGISSGIFSFCATDHFTHNIPDKITQSATHNLYRNATVSELVPSADGKRIIAARVLTPERNEVLVEADTFVVASGGFGVPQLLLNSKSAQHPNGVGNNRDVVGRYYIDHSLVLHGYFDLDGGMLEKLKFYDMRDVDGVSVIGSIGLPEGLKRKQGLQNLEAMLFPRPGTRDYNAFKSAQEFACALNQGRPMSHSFLQNSKNVLMGFPYLAHIAWQKYAKGMVIMPGLATGGWSKLPERELKQRYQTLELMGLTEQKAKPTNRVALSNELDPLGIPRISVHMDWDEDDIRSIRETEKLLVKGLQASGFGRFHSYAEENGGDLNYYTRTCHHLMGTARMGSDPATSVVDANCKIHGIENCYVASSAVFPSGGYANPTMTVLALSMRLADRLKLQAADVPDSVKDAILQAPQAAEPIFDEYPGGRIATAQTTLVHNRS